MHCKNSKCGGKLVPVNLLEDQPEKHRHYSNAKLIGFTDPNGYRCENSHKCTDHYVMVEGRLEWLCSEVRHDARTDIDDGEIWEIVDSWEMLGLSKLEVEHKEFMATTHDYLIEKSPFLPSSMFSEHVPAHVLNESPTDDDVLAVAEMFRLAREDADNEDL